MADEPNFKDAVDETSTSVPNTTNLEDISKNDETTSTTPQEHQPTETPVKPQETSQPSAQTALQQATNAEPTAMGKAGPATAPAIIQPNIDDHPGVQTAKILNRTAQILGGDRYSYNIDVKTGTMTKTKVPVSRGDIALAILANVLGGMGAGANVRTRNPVGAVGAGAGAVMQRRQEMDQEAQKQAKDDYGRNAQIIETNMRMHQNAMSMSNMDLAFHDKNIEGYKPLYDQLSKVNAIKDENLSGEDLMKLHVSKDMVIPTSRVARMNPDGSQATDSYGAPMWDYRYARIDPEAKVELPEDVKKILVANKVPGYVDPRTGEAIDLPPNLTMKARLVVSGIEKANAIKIADTEFKNFSQGRPVNAPSAGSKSAGGNMWSLFTDEDGRPDLNKLADSITKHEGTKETDRNIRNHNPGNLKMAGDAGKDADGFAKFSTIEKGKQALVDQLTRDMNRYPDASPEQYINNVYSPDKAEGNAPGQAKAYADALIKDAGKTAQTGVVSPHNDVYDRFQAALKDGSIGPEDFQTIKRVGGLGAFVTGASGTASKVDDMLAQKAPNVSGDSVAKIKNILGGTAGIDAYRADRDAHTALVKEQVLGPAKTAEKLSFAEQKDEQHKQTVLSNNKTTIDKMGTNQLFDLRHFMTMRSNDREILTNATAEKYPNWNPEEVKSRAELYENASGAKRNTVGSFSNSVMNANTSLGHMGGAIESMDRLKAKYPDIYTDTRMAKKGIAWFNDQVGNDPDWVRYKVAMETGVTDWQNLLNNQHALTDEVRKRTDKFMDADAPLANGYVGLKEMAHTAAVRILPLNEQWKRLFPGKNFPNMIESNTVDALKKINDPEVTKLLGNLDTGGVLTGTSDGAGTGGKSVSEALGQPKAQPTEQEVWIGGKLVGYSSDGGKTVSRLAEQGTTAP